MGGKNRISHVKIVVVAIALTLMMVLSSFGLVTAADTRQEEELILRVAMQDDIRTTNPLNAGGVWTWNVIGYLYDGPLNVNPETDELTPYIAVGCANYSDSADEIDWSDCTIMSPENPMGYNPPDTWANPEKSEATIFYDFTGVTWHDGVQMTIRDLLFSYHVQAQMPDWTSSVNCLKDKGGRSGSNYPNDHKLYIELVWEDGLRYALKYTLQEPFAEFFRNTLSAFLLPYHIWGTTASGQSTDSSKIWSDPGYDKDSSDAWSSEDATAFENPDPVGNGPFEWDYWDPAGGISKITTWRGHFYDSDFNPEYDPDGVAAQPNIDAIVYKIYKTAEAAVLALKNNDVDFIAWSVPPTFVGDLANEPGVTLQQSPEQGFFYLSYNMRKESFGYDEEASFPFTPEDDVAMPFRKAVAHCIDKNRIVQRLLLNFGVAGEGPVSSVSSWYNASIPKYTFDPEEAITILTDAGYQLTNPSLEPGPGNWWLRPDGQPIGNAAGGKIEILTPQADYDPIRAQAGIMIANQLQAVGIYAESIAMDFGSIVDRIDQRQFDMYILGWRIGSNPVDFLYAFFHSSTAVAGQNYPGYQNASFDAVIDHARQTGDEDERKQDVFDCQATIAYDLPYDVLYFRTNIEAYRSDNFVGWKVGSTGSIFNWRSISEIRQPSRYKLNAQFVNIESAMYSNQTIPVSVLVKDQDQLPVEGSQVLLNASAGSLTTEIDNTSSSGKVVTTFTAPYVQPTQDNINNGSTVIINIREATYTVGTGESAIEYDPAPSKLALLKIYPEGVDFLSISMVADPDVIDPDVEEDGTAGFTIIEVEVKKHTDANPSGDPVSGMDVYVSVDPQVPEISPATAITDSNGKATFTLTSVDLPDDDGSQNEFMITADAVDPSDTDVKPGVQLLQVYIVDWVPPTVTKTPFPTFLVIASLFCVGAIGYSILRRIKR
jgi:ABC-type transport system substrate-binding protein